RPPHPRDRVAKKVPLSKALLDGLADGSPLSALCRNFCTCGGGPACPHEQRRGGSGRRSGPGPKPLKGPATPSPEYLRRVAVPSRPEASDHPLLVLSLDGVVDARLPYHLSGGYTDILARPYLEPFLAYLLSPHSPWSLAFYTSLPRKQALETLKALNMPTGGPEKDERDGVVGLFARDDMRAGWSGSQIELKDLEVIWSELYEEEGVQWGVENTIVLTNDPSEMKKQPFSYVLAPELTYKSTTRPREDQFLLLMIAVLKDLETETNFAYHIKDMEWNALKIWTGMDEHSVNERNSYLLIAVRICADYRIPIKAFTGNEHA
ncbi:hypothetical protein JCM3770_005230, partial [Rhodotorula araucariae]